MNLSPLFLFSIQPMQGTPSISKVCTFCNVLMINDGVSCLSSVMSETTRFVKLNYGML